MPGAWLAVGHCRRRSGAVRRLAKPSHQCHPHTLLQSIVLLAGIAHDFLALLSWALPAALTGCVLGLCRVSTKSQAPRVCSADCHPGVVSVQGNQALWL